MRLCALLILFAIFASSLSPAHAHLYDFETFYTRVFSPYIFEYSLPTPRAGPLAIDVGFDGSVWFTQENATKLGRFLPWNGTFREYAVPAPYTRTLGLWGLAASRDAVWFTETYVGRIGRLDLANFTFTHFQVPTNNSGPQRIVVGSRGEVWFTEFNGGKIGRLQNGTFREFDVPTRNAGPFGLKFDVQGNLWFTEAYAGKIGLLYPHNSTIREFTPPFKVFSPGELAVERSGVVWFADHGASDLVRFDSRNQSWTKYPTMPPPREIYPVSLPEDMVIDGSGSIWFTLHTGNRIGRLNPANMSATEFHIPTSPVSNTLYLALDRIGNVWFAEFSGNKVGVIRTGNFSLPYRADVSARRISVVAGERFTANVSITPLIWEYEFEVSLEFNGLPRNVSVTFQKNPLVPPPAPFYPVFTVVDVVAEPQAKPGDYPVTFTVTDGKLAASQAVIITVKQRPTWFAESYVLLTAAFATTLAIAIFLRLRRRKKR